VREGHAPRRPTNQTLQQPKGLRLTSRKAKYHALKCLQDALGPWPCTLYGLQPPRFRAPGEEPLCARIQRALTDQRLTHETLARAIGVSRRVVSKVLSGEKALPPPWLTPIAVALKTSTQRLLRGIDWQPRASKPRRPRPKKPETPANAALRTRLRDLVKKYGLTYQEVATFIGVSRPMVGRVLAGRKRIPPAWVGRLAALFEMTVAGLLTGIPWPRRPVSRKKRYQA